MCTDYDFVDSSLLHRCRLFCRPYKSGDDKIWICLSDCEENSASYISCCPKDGQRAHGGFCGGVFGTGRGACGFRVLCIQVASHGAVLETQASIRMMPFVAMSRIVFGLFCFSGSVLLSLQSKRGPRNPCDWLRRYYSVPIS